MIQSYFNPHTECLLYQLLEKLSQTTAQQQDPFTKQTIIVPNSGMERYLQLQIAKLLGICSHLNFVYLGQYLWQQYQASGVVDAQYQALNKRQLTYEIFALLTESSEPILQPIQQTCTESSSRYQFAVQMATLFWRYADERPELLKVWANVNAQTLDSKLGWQARLYQLLPCREALNHARLQQQWQKQYLSTPSLADPTSLHLFGFHFIERLPLHSLLTLAERQTLYFYTLNPSTEYWTQIKKAGQSLKVLINDRQNNGDGNLDRHSQPSTDTTDSGSVDNLLLQLQEIDQQSLLGQYGQAGRVLIETLLDYPYEHLSETRFPIHKSNHLRLHFLQNSLQDSQTRATGKTPLTDIDWMTLAQDDSVVIHQAASPRREVEILKETLYTYLDADPTLSPADIMVMMPNIADYAEHIKGIFGANSGINSEMPYSLANQSHLTQSPICQHFSNLLTVIYQRIPSEALLALLAQNQQQPAYQFSTIQQDWLSQFALRQRIDWGVDAAYRERVHVKKASLTEPKPDVDWSIPPDKRAELAELYLAQGTWEQALTQCLSQSLCDPTASLSGEILAGIEKLLAIMHILNRSGEWLVAQYNLHIWYQALRQLIQQFYSSQSAEILIAELEPWYEEIQALDPAVTVSFQTLYQDLQDYFSSEALHGPFFSGGMAFCSLTPMRAIPSKIICILGLNAGYPRLSQQASFDLLAQTPHWGDRSVFAEQQYVFLETVLSARQKLYLSYCALDEYSNTALAPSGLLHSLMAFFQSVSISSPTPINLLQAHPLQSFVEDKTSATENYSRLYLTSNDTIKPKEFQEKSDKIQTTESQALTTLADLLDAFVDPLLYFAKHNLHWRGKALSVFAQENPLVYPSTGLQSYQLRKRLLDTLQSVSIWEHPELNPAEAAVIDKITASGNESLINDYYHALASDNLLPPYPAARLFYQSNHREMAAVCLEKQQLLAMGLGERRWLVRFQGHNYYMRSHLLALSNKAVLQQWFFSLGRLKEKHYLKALLAHVIASYARAEQQFNTPTRIALETPLETIIQTRDQTLCFASLTPQQARHKFAQLTKLYTSISQNVVQVVPQYHNKTLTYPLPSRHFPDPNRSGFSTGSQSLEEHLRQALAWQAQQFFSRCSATDTDVDTKANLAFISHWTNFMQDISVSIQK